ncbi:MAG: nucleoside/nucleotide kinase family protein [Devosia sp.]|nr:nucleoside/nucleotide kinase family protein [Devosia sp.]
MESEPQTLSLTPAAALAYLREEAVALLARPGRTALGLAGGPGTGKSTLAMQLVAALNAAEPGAAAYVPMDGFHMKHAKLEALGMAADKGMPNTFEGAAFADFLAALKAATGPVSGPGYSRKIEDVVEDAFTVPGETRLLVVEGNYLLLAAAPWWRIKPLLDRAVFIEVPRETVRGRLLKRHAEEGLFTEARNRAHIERVDLPNYDLVMRSKPRADVAIEIGTDD